MLIFIFDLNSADLIYDRMSWVAGVRAGKLYTVSMRPLDPRLSKGQLHRALSICATGLHLGWDEKRAFQAAEGIVMQEVCPGIVWTNDALLADIDCLMNHEEIT